MSRSLKCLNCINSQTYSTEDDLEAHIAYVHMKLMAYECELCEFSKFPTEYTVAKHCAEIHALRECKIILNYSPENKASQKMLADKLKKCIEASGSSETIPPINSVMPPIASDHAPAPTTVAATANRVQIKREAPEMPEVSLAKRFDTEGSMERRASQDTSEAHSRPEPTVHVGHSAPIEPISEDDTELEVSRESRFSKPPTRVICVLCSANVKSASQSKTTHANTNHGTLFIFECGYCAQKFNKADANCVRRHIRNNHRQVDGSVDENKFIDYRWTLRAELQELRDKCFPRRKTE